ncbi:MAG: site-specific integrase [Bacteroidales bacterium]|nr:site-specific integrase [Bacteroidales bacterium]
MFTNCLTINGPLNKSLNTKIILRKDFIRKDETACFYIRITINRKTNYISLNKFIKPSFWDEGKGIVKSQHPLSNKINHFLIKEKLKIDDILLNLQLQNKEISFNILKKTYSNNSEPLSFFDFFKKEIELMPGKYAKGTIKYYKKELSKLKKFRNTILITDIDLNFLNEYEFYLRNKLNNCTNTISGSFKAIKKLLNIAIRKNLITKNPFAHLKIRYEETHKEFLTIEELKSLEKLLIKNIPEKLKNVLRYFLFACYTGVRYSDMERLKSCNINNNQLSFKQHKTKEYITIPLTRHAIKHLTKKEPEEKLFRVITNQKTNEFLKIIILYANINKNISFHCSRHTFAVISLTIGIPIEVISKILGHKDLKTTQIYAKIVDKLKFKEMEKWNNL